MQHRSSRRRLTLTLDRQIDALYEIGYSRTVLMESFTLDGVGQMAQNARLRVVDGVEDVY